MAQNKETKLWHELKNLDPKWHFTRVESSTINGIPKIKDQGLIKAETILTAIRVMAPLLRDS